MSGGNAQPISMEALWSLGPGNLVRLDDKETAVYGQVLAETDGKWLHVRYEVPGDDPEKLNGVEDLVTQDEIVEVVKS